MNNLDKNNLSININCFHKDKRLAHYIAFGRVKNLKQASAILCKHPNFLKVIDSSGDLPLNNALLKDQNISANFLLNHIIKLFPPHEVSEIFNYRNGDGHNTLICLASSKCDEKLVNDVLKYSSSIDETDIEGRSAFHHAVCYGKYFILKKLIQKALKQNKLSCLMKLDSSQLSPLHLAVIKDNEDKFSRILKLLLKFCPDVNHLSSSSGSSLDLAIKYKLFTSLETLLYCDNVNVNTNICSDKFTDSKKSFSFLLDRIDQYPANVKKAIEYRLVQSTKAHFTSDLSAKAAVESANFTNNIVDSEAMLSDDYDETDAESNASNSGDATVAISESADF